MKILKEGIQPNSFFRTLRKATARVLLLDYDGTLAPFRVERDEAFAYPGITEILNALIETDACRAVLISGRSVEALTSLLKLKRLPEIWGSHGWERLMPDGNYKMPTLNEQTTRRLSEARDWAQTEGLLPQCEQKPASFALHWRGVNEIAARELREKAIRKWSSLTSDSDLVIKEFDGGIELSAVGRNKGDAVRTLVSEMPKDTVFAYLGDDLTDEDAFRELQGKGLSVLVRPELRSTTADLWLRPPEELIEFLNNWLESCKNKQ